MTDKFIGLGHRIIGCARTATAVDQLTQHYGSPHQFTRVDVADNAQVQTWSQQLLETSTVPDILINNAGVINQLAPLWEVPVAEFDQVVDVNLKGTANVIRQFVPAMIERGSGIIVNFSSGWGRSTSPEVAPYCATKWAIEGLTQALAQELPRSMAAVALNPGIIHTEMLSTCFGESAAAYDPPELWANRAVETILSIQPRHNGQPLTVRG